MFHIIFKISKSILIPAIFIIVEVVIKKTKKQNYQVTDLCSKWLLFWVIGFGVLIAGLMQAINPNYTAELLNVRMTDMIVIRELGWIQIGIGLIGLLSIKYESFRKPTAIAYGVFMLGATIMHIARLRTINFDEIASLIDDIWVFAVTVFVLWHKIRMPSKASAG